MNVASNPTLHRQEYQRKLYKLLSSNTGEQSDDTMQYFANYVAGGPVDEIKAAIRSVQQQRTQSRPMYPTVPGRVSAPLRVGAQVTQKPAQPVPEVPASYRTSHNDNPESSLYEFPADNIAHARRQFRAWSINHGVGPAGYGFTAIDN